MSDKNTRKQEIIEIKLHPETIEGMDVQKCVDEIEAFNVLENIRDLLVYLTTLDIKGSEERSQNYHFSLDLAIQNIEEAQNAASM